MKLRRITAEEQTKLAQKTMVKNSSKTTQKLLSNAEKQQNHENKRKRGRPKKVETVVETIAEVKEEIVRGNPTKVHSRQDIYKIEKQSGLYHTENEIDDTWYYEIPVLTKKN